MTASGLGIYHGVVNAAAISPDSCTEEGSVVPGSRRSSGLEASSDYRDSRSRPQRSRRLEVLPSNVLVFNVCSDVGGHVNVSASLYKELLREL